MIRKAALTIPALLVLLLARTGYSQLHQGQGFVERNDTAFVRAAGVVLLGLSDRAIHRAWDSARTAVDTANANTTLDDYYWYLGTSQKLLESLHIPSYKTGCRYICVVEDAKEITFDRRTFLDSDEVEQYDALVYDGRSLYRFLPDFQRGNPDALTDVKRVLHLSD